MVETRRTVHVYGRLVILCEQCAFIGVRGWTQSPCTEQIILNIRRQVILL